MVYMDLGMSSMQVDARERGFSYSYDAPLDMRMDTRQEFSAADLLNEWPESRIAQVLRRFGEERYSGGIAREIVSRRPLRSTSDLVAAVKAGIPPSARFGGGHPAKRTFQAVRIAVNGELDSLDDALPTAWQMLPVGGRFAAISFHSLEDRRVKRFLAERARGCVCPPELPVCACGREPEAELLTRRAVAPQPAELATNPRSRSAHLRRGRAWIGVLGLLLAGIVALNVVTLSLAAGGSQIDQNIQALDQENSILRSRDAQRSGAARVRHGALALGLTMPSADSVGYVQAGPNDVEIAAQRLAAAGSAY
jgi:hypothetical protein